MAAKEGMPCAKMATGDASEKETEKGLVVRGAIVGSLVTRFPVNHIGDAPRD